MTGVCYKRKEGNALFNNTLNTFLFMVILNRPGNNILLKVHGWGNGQNNDDLSYKQRHVAIFNIV